MKAPSVVIIVVTALALLAVEAVSTLCFCAASNKVQDTTLNNIAVALISYLAGLITPTGGHASPPAQPEPPKP